MKRGIFLFFIIFFCLLFAGCSVSRLKTVEPGDASYPADQAPLAEAVDAVDLAAMDGAAGEKEAGENSSAFFLNEEGEWLWYEDLTEKTDSYGQLLKVVWDKGEWVAMNAEGKRLFRVFSYDNGPDYVKEGLFRILDENGRVGFADTKGNIVVKPQFAFAFPFEGETTWATYEGESKEVPGSGGEYHYWVSERWYEVTKEGEIRRGGH